MKKIILMIAILIFTLTTQVYATEVSDTTNIPIMSLEEFALMMQARQAKVDIIKKNNVEIVELKNVLKSEILEAAEKVNALNIDITEDSVSVSDETIEELKELLDFLQEGKDMLESDAQKVSDEVDKILDLISTKGMQLEQYDLLIENQNTVIVRMKEILNMVNRI